VEALDGGLGRRDAPDVALHGGEIGAELVGAFEGDGRQILPGLILEGPRGEPVAGPGNGAAHDKSGAENDERDFLRDAELRKELHRGSLPGARP
jgi:hypothetical protein